MRGQIAYLLRLQSGNEDVYRSLQFIELIFVRASRSRAFVCAVNRRHIEVFSTRKRKAYRVFCCPGHQQGRWTGQEPGAASKADGTCKGLGIKTSVFRQNWRVNRTGVPVLFWKQTGPGDGSAGQDRCSPPVGRQTGQVSGTAWKACGTLQKGLGIKTSVFRQPEQLGTGEPTGL